jgi:hypothetical protein
MPDDPKYILGSNDEIQDGFFNNSNSDKVMQGIIDYSGGKRIPANKVDLTGGISLIEIDGGEIV